MPIHNYFFPFSKYLSCAIFSFFKSTINSFHLLFLAFSLGEISPKQNDVSGLFTGGNFPRPVLFISADVWLFLSILWYSYMLFISILLEGEGGGEISSPLNAIWHEGPWWPPKCFWPLCPNALEEEAETWWLLILIYGASKKVIFGSLGYPVLLWQRVCQGELEIFLSYRSICFLIAKF